MYRHVTSVFTATGATHVPKATATWDERKHRMCCLCGVGVGRLVRGTELFGTARAVQQAGQIIGNRYHVALHDDALLDFRGKLTKLKSLDASHLNGKQTKALRLVITKAAALDALYPTV